MSGDMTSRERFLDLMKNKILKLDLADLDFGIYRILNHRRAVIEGFFDEELPRLLDEAIKGGEPQEEDRLYNYLYTFFSRYYRDGDFQPQQRRGSEAKYAVPYNGEDVHFHWRSKGSHYVKTAEELRSYTFKCATLRVRFEVRGAYPEPDNVKGDTRYLIPVPEDCASRAGADGPEFVVPFVLRRLTPEETKRYSKKAADVDGNSVQERIVRDTVEEINRPRGLTQEELLRHLLRYTRKSRSDYFVRRGLGGFLERELDYFLKAEVLDLDATTTMPSLEAQILRASALRAAARRVIAILNEIESFQAVLFEKRKFVLASEWCFTVDRLPRALWPRLLESEPLLDEWHQIFGFRPQSIDQLESHQNLVVDTALAADGIKSGMLASLADIEEASDGLAVKGDAFHVLSLVAPLYRGRVRCSYIDPPFNTETDQFAYQDAYRSSTWLTLVSERLLLARDLLSPDGSQYVHLDHNSVYLIRPVMDSLFGESGFLNEIIWRIGWVSGYKTAAQRFVRNHETILLYGKGGQPYFDKEAARIPYSGFAADTIKEELTSIASKWGFDRSKAGPLKIVLKNRNGYVWKLALETESGKYNVEDTWNANEYEELHSNKIKRNAAEYTPNGSAITQKPEQLLRRIVEVSSATGDIVLDYFAGTGTTGAVAKKLGRRFVLAEPNSYFESDLIWRLKHVLHGTAVGISAQVGHTAGGLFQYLRIETYSDVLDSLRVGEPALSLAEDQTMSYVLPGPLDQSETMLSTDKLEHPFDYQLQIHTEEGLRPQPVDLATTFNLIKGIRMRRYREFDHDGRRYVIVEGQEGDELVLVVWRDVTNLNPKAEREFLIRSVQESLGALLADYARIWHNADSALPGGISLDAEFKRLMFEPEESL